jgi:hypothetical protein
MGPAGFQAAAMMRKNEDSFPIYHLRASRDMFLIV